MHPHSYHLSGIVETGVEKCPRNVKSAYITYNKPLESSIKILKTIVCKPQVGYKIRLAALLFIKKLQGGILLAINLLILFLTHVQKIILYTNTCQGMSTKKLTS